MPERIDAVGILESYSMAAMVIAADAVLKAAELYPIEIRLGTGLGGKSYFTFTGEVAAVQTGVDTGKASLGEAGMMFKAEVIPSTSDLFISRLL